MADLENGIIIYLESHRVYILRKANLGLENGERGLFKGWYRGGVNGGAVLGWGTNVVQKTVSVTSH